MTLITYQWETESVVTDSSAQLATLTFDKQNQPHVFYLSSGRFCHAARALDGTWTTEVVDSAARVNDMVWPWGNGVADSDGNLHGTWHYFTASSPLTEAVFYGRKAVGGGWSITKLYESAVNQTWNRYSCVSCDEDDTLRLAFMATGVPQIATSSGGGWSIASQGGTVYSGELIITANGSNYYWVRDETNVSYGGTGSGTLADAGEANAVYSVGVSKVSAQALVSWINNHWDSGTGTNVISTRFTGIGNSLARTIGNDKWGACAYLGSVPCIYFIDGSNLVFSRYYDSDWNDETIGAASACGGNNALVTNRKGLPAMVYHASGVIKYTYAKDNCKVWWSMA